MARGASSAMLAAYRAGHSIVEVARLCHTPASTVAGRLRRSGEPMRPAHRPRGARAEMRTEIEAMKKEATP